MVKCSFCGDEIKLGGGKMYARKEGTVFFFCSNKCEKNQLALGRKPVKTRWTEQYNKLKKTLLSAKKEEKANEKQKEKQNDKVSEKQKEKVSEKQND